MDTTKHYEIYTDGACSGNPGPGGIGYVIITPDGRRLNGAASYRRTTNNRMEILAVVVALDSVYGLPVAPVVVHTDSQLVYGSMMQGWKRKANLDLWAKLDAAKMRLTMRGVTVTFDKVKGHADDSLNNEADRLATMASTAMAANELRVDEGYEALPASEPDLFSGSTVKAPVTEPEPEDFDFPEPDTSLDEALLTVAANGGEAKTYDVLAGLFATGALSLEALAAALRRRLS